VAAAGDEPFVLAHGGPLTTPRAVHAALAAIPTFAGSFGASAIERAVRAAAAAFKQDDLATFTSDGP
jgi:predicted TIM-barrel enzyme